MARALLLAASCALILVPAAAAKQGVTARLVAPLPLAAPAGTPIVVEWTLSANDRGRRVPFGAGGLFVDLRSATAARTSRGWATGSGGRHSARLRVPAGGIGAVDVGLMGWRYGRGGPATGRGRAAPLLFALENDPFAAAAAVDGRPPRMAAWMLAAAAAALGAALGARRALTARRALA